MTKLYLFHVGQKKPGDDWVLVLEDERVRLLDENDEERAAFPAAGAHQRFTFPNFWLSIKHLGIDTGHGRTEWFSVEDSKLARIREYLAGSPPGRGATGVRGTSVPGILFVAGGAVVTCFGAIMLAGVFAQERPLANTMLFVSVGIVAGGLALIARGVTLLMRARVVKEDKPK